MADSRVEPVLHNVRPTGKQSYNGAFGKVEEVEVRGTMCVAKRLHKILLKSGTPRETGLLSQRFASECEMMSKLRHPHIVAFLGTSYTVNGSQALIMEKLPYSLSRLLLDWCVEIPLCLKWSILGDVTRGLIYLHSLSIIHRDISPTDVLLTSSFEAKIGDFGVSKYVMRSEQDTQIPGKVLFMPPEALAVPAKYGTPLDIFSFGVLALSTLTQEFPGDIRGATFIGENDEVVARSEVERREKYFAKIYFQLKRSHPLVRIIEQCLANDSKKRPTAEMILPEIVNEVNSVSEDDQLSAKIKTMEMIGSKDQGLHEEIEKDIPEKVKPYARKAKPTGKTLGHGTYGTVLEMESCGEILAGKVFKRIMPHSSSQMQDKLYAEIVTMATFQHPNLVRFIGLCFLPHQSDFPVLLMERMMTDLHTYLLDPQNRTLFARKVLILRDVTSGLEYLHQRRHALVHRDLTSKNVLLNAELMAKIGDFGTGRIMDLDPEATPDTLTAQPGTLGYMAPEAMTGHAQYDIKIDIFAFGHLMLFAILQTQVPLLPPTYPSERGSLRPRSEVKRRQKSIDKASESLGKCHPLVVILKRCLHNLPGQRPSASEILTKIQEIISDMQQKAQEEVTVKGKNTVHDEVTLGKLLLMKLPNGERVKIVETIAKDWRIVGCQLNFDRAGNRLSIIEGQKSNNPIACCEAMFQHWLNGNGVKPATWKTLIDILEDCDYIALKEQVERAFSH